MITVCRLNEIDFTKHDKIYNVARKVFDASDKVYHLIELAPSKSLMLEKKRMIEVGMWNSSNFKELFVPKYLKELKNPLARKILNKLYRMDRQSEDIVIACFCAEEWLCHRSILAGLFQGAGCHVKTASNEDYSYYYSRYKSL